MPFNRPSLSQIQNRVQADLQARIEGSTPSLRRSVLGVFASALSSAIHSLYGFVAYRSEQSVPYSATGDDLARWASLWSVGRRQPTYASGSITITGDPAATIAAGTALQSANGIEYQVSNPVVLDGTGSAVALVTTQAPGAVGNQAGNTLLSFISPALGVDAVAQITADGINGGAELEDDDSLRARMMERIQNPPHGGNAFDYEIWATSVRGVSRAWVFPLYLGAGNVRVYIADDSYAGVTLASAATVAAAQAYIDSVRPVTADVDVVAPNRQAVNIRVTLGPDTPAIRASVQAALADLFTREAAPEGTILLTHVREAISQAVGEYDHNLITPSANVTAAAGAILVLGTLTWT